MLKNYTLNVSSVEQLLQIVEERKTEKDVYFKNDIRFIVENDELKLVVSGGKVLPIRETALPSILSRMEVGGRTFYKMSDTELNEIFKTTASYMPDVLSVMTSDGAVNSINSALYAHYPMEEIINDTIKAFEEYYKGEIVIKASIGYDVTHIKFITDKKVTFNNKTRKLLITLTNSENGMSSVKYGVYIQDGSGLIPIMDDESIVHIGNEDEKYDKIIESLSKITGVIDDALKRLRKLQKKEVIAVNKAINEMARRNGIPKKYAEAVAKDFVNRKTCFASEIYEAFAIAVTDQENLNTLERYKNNVLKLIDANWNEFMN